jgi:hypothetical protein
MFHSHAHNFITHCIQQVRQDDTRNKTAVNTNEINRPKPLASDVIYECNRTLNHRPGHLPYSQRTTQSTVYNLSPCFKGIEEGDDRSSVLEFHFSPTFHPPNTNDQLAIQLDVDYTQDDMENNYNYGSDSDTNSSMNLLASSLSSDWDYDESSDYTTPTSADEAASQISLKDLDYEDFQTENNAINLMPSTQNPGIESLADEEISKSFLQMRGISIANYNMGCNFDISLTMRLMMQYQLYMLAIQEHTPWSRELSQAEISSYKKHCDKWGYFMVVSKLQIIIIDKQLTPCIRETGIHEDGRLIHLRLEISTRSYVNFVATYGYPHSPNNRSKRFVEIADENTVLQKMRQLKRILTTIIKKATNVNELLFVFGDLQDTPDNSKMFSYGNSHIVKHPLWHSSNLSKSWTRMYNI